MHNNCKQTAQSEMKSESLFGGHFSVLTSITHSSLSLAFIMNNNFFAAHNRNHLFPSIGTN